MANVVVDLGSIGTLTVEDATIPGTSISIITVMKYVLDQYKPPLKDGNGDEIPYTNPEYVQHLLDYLDDRGRTSFLNKVQAIITEQYRAANPEPKVRDYITLA